MKGLVFSPAKTNICDSGSNEELDIYLDDWETYQRRKCSKDEGMIFLIVCTWHGRDTLQIFRRHEGLILVPTGDPVVDEEERVECQRVGSFSARENLYSSLAAAERVRAWNKSLREEIVSII